MSSLQFHRFSHPSTRPIQCQKRTDLTIVIPICIHRVEVLLTEARHKRDLPEDRLMPRPRRLHLDVSPGGLVRRHRHERDLDLLRLEVVLLQAVEVGRREVRAVFFEACALLCGQGQLVEVYGSGNSQV